MKNYIYLFLLFIITLGCIFTLNSIAYSESDEEVIELDVITVTATRAEKDIFRTPNAVSVLNQKLIARSNAEHGSNILRDSVGVIAQETTVGQGSPMLRSLTGYQTVIQVDWVRLNNSTFRSGPNQYTATIAPENLGRAEVLLGSNSMLYGSGALGGVVNFFTRDVQIDTSKQNLNIQPRFLARYSSASQERLGRIEFTGSQGKLGFIVGGGMREYGNITPGSGYDLHYKNRKFEIVDEKPIGVDLYNYNDIAQVKKDDVPDKWLIQTEGPLSWSAVDVDAKIGYQLNNNSIFNVAYQMWRQPKTPRYDKIAPQEFTEFYFEPQHRDLVYLNYVTKPEIGSIDFIRFTSSFHRQKEGRNEVQRDAISRRQRYDTVNTIGITTQTVSSILPKQRLIGGAEFYLDLIQSRTVKTDLETGEETVDENLGRFINGSQFWDASIYLQDEIQIHDRVEVTLGGRATLYQTNADLSIRSDAFEEFNKLDSSITGSAGVVIGVTDYLNFVSSFGTAFRAPSLNDTTAVEVTNEGITAPSPDLKPETSWTVETGLKAKHTIFSGSLTFFYSRVNGLVARKSVQEAYEGETIPELHQELIDEYKDIDVLVFDNVDKAQFQGIELSAVLPIDSSFSIYGNAAYMRGEVLLINGISPDPEKPWEARTRREPPLNGIIGIEWEPTMTPYWLTLFVRGAAEQRRLNRSDIRDPRIQGKTRDTAEVQFDGDGNAIDAGTPGWWTLNLRGGFKLSEVANLTLSFENLLNRRYRVHGSGVNSPGFNVSISLDNRF